MTAETRAEPLSVTVRLLLRQLFDGRTLGVPVADLDKSSLGGKAEVLEEQRLFLEAHLAKEDAETLARFSMPGPVELLDVEAVIERDDLPRTLQVTTPICFDTILLPLENGDAWVVVPAIEHTLYVSRQEDRREVIAKEIQRVAAAKLADPGVYRTLLPAKKDEIETMDVAVERDERLPAGRAASLKKQLIERRKRRDAKKVLSSIAIPIHERPLAKAGPPVVGRNRLLASLDPLLTGKRRLSILLLGDELVGKSAVVYEWLRRAHARGDAPLVYGTSGAQLIAAMSGLGQWQERVRRVMEAAAELDAILYFDDLSDLFGDRATSTIDIPNAMKPYLEDGRVRVLAELGTSAFSNLERRSAGFFSCLTRLRVEALETGQARRALEQRVAHDLREAPDRPNLVPAAIDTVMDLADRYLVYQPHPGKVMRMYDELRAIYERDVDSQGRPHPIDPARVLDAFSRQTGIPSFLLREDRALERSDVVRRFERRIIGQKDAVARVVDTICVVKAGLQPTGKPLATFLFIGPTGVGKTELARTLAEFLFGAADRMVRFDMSEYADPFAAERLIRGTDRAEGLLTRKIRQQPFSVLLLDEIEKAHPAVLDLLLQVCGEGRLTDARGKTAFFHNAIIIMTSNLGASHRRTAIGIDAPSTTTEAHYRRHVENAFRPELVNRLDRIIVFEPLTAEEVLAVARVALDRIERRRGFTELGVQLAVDDAALEHLAAAGYSETYGARAIRRMLENELVAPLSELLARAGREARSARLVVAIEGTERPAQKRKPLVTTTRGLLSFSLYGGRAASEQKDALDTDRIGALRRKAKQYLALDAVHEAREQLAHLRAELSRDTDDDGDARDAKERAEMMRDHHRYQEAWGAVERCTEDLVVAEELAMGALFSGQDPGDAKSEAEAVFAELRSKLVYLLLARERTRDRATFTLTELDDGRALNRWLVPGLASFAKRGWNAEIHIPFERTDEPHGIWGPPVPHDRLEERLAKADRKKLTLLLRISGAYAGVLLALEAGRHVFARMPAAPAHAELVIRLVTMRTQIAPAHYAREELTPPAPTHTLRTSTPIVRDHDFLHGRMKIFRQESSSPMVFDEYWKRLEETTLDHLLVYERDPNLDREQLFVGPLDRAIGLEADQ